jgi:hypothetical protein
MEKITDKRNAKILFQKSGGNARGEALISRVTLPISWVKEMEITKDNRNVILIFDKEEMTITIKKRGVNYG